MALSWDYVNKVITVPQSDLTLVSGTIYECDTIWLKDEINAEISDEQHIWVDDVYVRTPDIGPIVGTTFAGTIQLVNGWSIEFSPNSQWSVVLVGSNNDFWDVASGNLLQNQVQVIPTNSAGLVIGSGGSGSAADVWAHILSTGNSADTEVTKARKAAEMARNLSA